MTQEKSGISQLVSIGFALFLPFIIRQLLGLCRKQTEPEVSRASALAYKHRAGKPQKTMEKSLQMLLLAVAAWNLIQAWIVPMPNVLATWQVTADAPSYILRRKAMEHISNSIGGGEMGQELARAFVMDNDAKLLELKPAREVLRLRRLYELLKDNDKRVLYLHHGEQAYLDCRWCSKSNSADYNLYNIPWILLSYTGMLGLLIIVTGRPGFGHWRYYGVLALSAMFCYLDLFLPLSSDMGARKNWDSLWAYRNRWRRSAFAAMALAFVLLKPSDEVTNEDVLAALVDQHQQILSTMNATRMQRAAVMEEDTLRRAYFDFAKSRSAANNLVNGDSEVEAAKKLALQKYNLDKIFPEDERLVQELVSQAISKKPVEHEEDE
jgi:hypothetical protein